MFSIGTISKLSGIKIPAIRYYEQMGLVTTPARSTGNQRRYSNAQLERLSFIKHARALGFTLESISSLINLSNNTNKDCGEIDQLTKNHLGQVQKKLALLTRLETELQRMVTGCAKGELKQCYVVQSLLNHDLCLDEHD